MNLYDTIGLIAEKMPEKMQVKEVQEEILPIIIKKWETTRDGDPALKSLFGIKYRSKHALTVPRVRIEYYQLNRQKHLLILPDLRPEVSSSNPRLPSIRQIQWEKVRVRQAGAMCTSFGHAFHYSSYPRG